MASLEEITVGSSVTGLSGKGAVTIVSVKWHGNSVLEIVFKDSAGQLGEQMLYREDEASLGIQDSSLPWSFDADANLLRLTSEVYRIHLAHLFDPYRSFLYPSKRRIPSMQCREQLSLAALRIVRRTIAVLPG